MTKKNPKRFERPGVDRLGRTPLHCAASEANFVDASRLVEAGADVNAQDNNGWTPLHFAAQSGDVQIVSLLLAKGADVDRVDSNGNSALFRAVFSYEGDGALIVVLRAQGADPLLQNNHGVSPVALSRAIANRDVRRFFGDLPLTKALNLKFPTSRLPPVAPAVTPLGRERQLLFAPLTSKSRGLTGSFRCTAKTDTSGRFEPVSAGDKTGQGGTVGERKMAGSKQCRTPTILPNGRVIHIGGEHASEAWRNVS